MASFLYSYVSHAGMLYILADKVFPSANLKRLMVEDEAEFGGTYMFMNVSHHVNGDL